MAPFTRPLVAFGKTFLIANGTGIIQDHFCILLR